MKILLITPQLPYPPEQGTSLRNFHILRGLAERHDLTLLSVVEDDQRDGEVPVQLRALCESVERVAVPVRSSRTRLWQMVSSGEADMALRLRSEPLAAALRKLLGEQAFDVVQVEGLELAWLMPIVRAHAPGSTLVFDAHNAETVLQERAGSADRSNPRRWPAAAYSQVQSSRLCGYETWAVSEADWVTAVSESDAAALRSLYEGAGTAVTVIPNSIDVAAYVAANDEPSDEKFKYDVVFSGKMDYRPNVDAVLWFADEVWPLIRRQLPLASWAIVGQKPHARLARLAVLPGVTVTGRVEDVKPYLRQAGVFVMPFRVGSGTRLKLIEALAAGLPVVSTPLGAEGFPVKDGGEMLLAEDAEGFAAAVLRILNDKGLRRSLGTAGQEFARAYDWRVVVPRFDEVYAKLRDGKTAVLSGGRSDA